MHTHQHYEVGQHVFVLDLELMGTIVDVEHVDDYVLDDAAFESPKSASFQIAVAGETVWRTAREIRAVPSEVTECIITSDEPSSSQDRQ